MNKKISVIKLMGDILSPFSRVQDPPIYIVGMPRTGTTWVASTLSTARGIKYFHEPFSPKNVKEAGPHCGKYLSSEDEDEEFAKYCQEAFAGKIEGKYLQVHLGWLYRMLPWWPGRAMVKEVHSRLALEWIHQHITPLIVIVIRHPCGFAASWSRLWGETKLSFPRGLVKKKKLMSEYLQPFESVLLNAQGFWEKMGALWGAYYHIMLEQQRQHPEWIVVQHEQLCLDPIAQYRQLFDRLNLKWTLATDYMLESSTTKESRKPYVTERISAQEPDKWKKQLSSDQIGQVRKFVQPFGIPYYADF